MRSTRALFCVLLAAGVLWTPAAPAGAAPASTASSTWVAPTVVYGDSLLYTSELELREVLAMPPRHLLVRARWGAAPCDWRTRMLQDATRRPAVVVVAFFGNMATPCTAGLDPHERYRADARWVARLYEGTATEVVLVAAPGAVGTRPGSRPTAAFAEVADEFGLTFLDAGREFVDTTGTYAREVRGVQVRSSDGAHLCETESLIALRCPPGPGVRRYAEAVGAAADAGRGAPVAPVSPRVRG